MVFEEFVYKITPYLLTKEGLGRSVLGDYHTQRQPLSRFFIGAIVLSDPVLEVTRREMRKMSPDVKIDTEQIKEVILQEIFKRDVVEGEKAEEARRKIARVNNRVLRKSTSKESSSINDVVKLDSEPEAIVIPAL